MTDDSSGTQQSKKTQSAEGSSITLTPELVEEVTERVYRMLLAELRIEREQNRLPVRHRSKVRLH